jgi:FixJ family two-component response regulator
MHSHGILLPIIFLTAHGNIPTSVRAIKAGATDFLTKPVEADALVLAVRATERLSIGKSPHSLNQST